MATPPLMPARDPQEAPASTMPWRPGQARVLSGEEKGKWTARTARGERLVKLFWPQWERALKAYAEALVPERKGDVDALLDYRHVEGKKAQLFHRTPEVTLTPIDPQDPAVPAWVLPVRQKFLNYELGPNGANAKRALHKTLIDTLAASGWMVVKVGYEQVTLPVPPDPMTGMQQVGADGQPLQVPIWSRRFLEAVSSKRVVVPDGFRDTEFDKAPWLAVKGRMPIAAARRLKWTIPPDFQGSTSKDETHFAHTDGEAAPGEQELTYTEIWLKAHLYDPAVFNPELYRCLILVDGLDEPAWYVDSPYQSLTPEGALTDDSMRGNPIHMGTLRDLIDSAFVPSDLVVGEQLSTELNKFRTGLIESRKERRPITLVSAAVGQETAEKILRERAAVVSEEMIGDGGSQRIVAVVQAGTEPRDNYTSQDIVERDYDESLGVSANQRGQFAKTKRTATEVRAVQGNSSARAQVEQDRIREYFIALVRKFDCLVQRTATQAELAKVLGQQGAALWEQWRALPGRYAYDVLPDSGQYVDVREYQDQSVNLYNLTRKDPRVNPEELLTRVARAHHLDPAKFIAPPKDENPEPVKLSLSFKGEDAVLPQGLLLLELLKLTGMPIGPQLSALLGSAMAENAMNPPEAQHEGAADKTEPVNQHATERTGRVQGSVQ